MNTAPQELMKEYVQSQHFTSTAEIMTAMKEMFRDVVQTVMEVEMDEELGRERCQRAETFYSLPFLLFSQAACSTSSKYFIRTYSI